MLLSPCIDIVLIFHILVDLEYWVLTESRIQLNSMLGGVRNVAFSISSHEQLFSNIVGSLFLNEPFSR